ncbi:putative aldo-keto reductase [Moniliophthora roreri MCA 2997]|uniref:Aldo-keto reductase n=1 Tax=Moniliophthora roreri (strain MCA 2997) TaxID=1381753 RepID=V2X7H6_MONRO|nr:putative aldo-keto reductase [Moniliophthora roreri MCA 2997]KAI3596598.1 putative aldo-keto reductase [Moniliophthora roreri]
MADQHLVPPNTFPQSPLPGMPVAIAPPPESSIPQRKIGGIAVPAIGLGVMGLAATYDAADDDEERLSVLDTAYEAGCTFWDTADVYGDSEDLIGEWFRRNPEKRSKVFLATKFGLTMIGARGDPSYVKEACNLSLQRLGVDYIDLYYQHRVDKNIPIEKTVEAMAELVKEGKVRYLGLSDCTADGLRRANAIHPIAALQIEFSPMALEVELPHLNLIQAARSCGAKIIAYSPLGRGFLTGQIHSLEDLESDDCRRNVPRLSQENIPKILSLTDEIAEMGKKHNATAGQTALAWTLAQGDDFFVIPGSTTTEFLRENVGAATVKLSSREVSRIRKLAKEADIQGAGYSAGWNDLVYVDSPPLL